MAQVNEFFEILELSFQPARSSSLDAGADWITRE
jgi:hypothetical protein